MVKDLLKREAVRRAGKAARPLLKKAVKKAAKMDPRARALLKAAEWAAGRVSGRSRSDRRAALGARALTAAAIALPIGLWVGSRLRSSED